VEIYYPDLIICDRSRRKNHGIIDNPPPTMCARCVPVIISAGRHCPRTTHDESARCVDRSIADRYRSHVVRWWTGGSRTNVRAGNGVHLDFWRVLP
jgi:hypothetical protein